jgi:RimJ/RimL family protein N-acetyltransferase
MDIPGSVQIQAQEFSLRPISEKDADLIVAASFSDIPDWTFIPRAMDRAAARRWIRRGFPARENGQMIRFVIKQAGQLAGLIGAHHPFRQDQGIVEIFYFILPNFRCQGLATASLKVINGWIQQVTPALRRLQLHVIIGNLGSAQVAERAGYRYEGIALNQIPPVNGFGPRDAAVYGLPLAIVTQTKGDQANQVRLVNLDID